MANPYIFFCDIDGTLIRGKMQLPQRVKDAARRFAEAGGKLALATGRSHVSTDWLARELEVEMPCILFSGAVIYDFREQRLVHGTPLPKSVLSALEEVLARYPDVSLQAYGLDRIYLLNVNDHFMKKGVQEEIEPSLSSLEDASRDAVYKLVMASPDPGRLEAVGKALFSGPQYHFAFASRHFAEVVSSGAEKGAAARRLAEQYGVPMARTFAAGDAMTDYPLLTVCAYGFAPVDAAQKLLDLADCHIPLCEDGGMEQAFDEAVRIMGEKG